MRTLEFGWFLPTSGDTIAYGTKEGAIAPSMELFERIARAAEASQFEYMLVPVASSCWDAYIVSSMILAKTRSLKMLVAARPGYANPVLMARMIAAIDQLSGGRVAVNLIAGQSDDEARQDGVSLAKEDRYAMMDEDVTVMKQLWSSRAPLEFRGRFHTLNGARVSPRPSVVPRFYLGGGSQEAWELSAKHSSVHLFWGDTVDTIRANMASIRAMAARHGRQDEIGFGMRLQMICRPTEEEAWEAARALVANVTEAQTEFIRTHYSTSAANRRVQELAITHGDLIAPHLWTGITRVRPGAGIVVVGNPQQCADTLQQFIDLGCHSFCLSGYLHDEECVRFAKWVRPLIAERNPGRMPVLPAATGHAYDA
jgi:alkanesulfonate monooxygenase